MGNCPNCGRETLRTKDWACQWCGYQLLSGFYRRIDKTYKELQQELQAADSAETGIGKDTEEEYISGLSPEPQPEYTRELKPEPPPPVAPSPPIKSEPSIQPKYEPTPAPEPDVAPEPVVVSEPDVALEPVVAHEPAVTSEPQSIPAPVEEVAEPQPELEPETEPVASRDPDPPVQEVPQVAEPVTSSPVETSPEPVPLARPEPPPQPVDQPPPSLEEIVEGTQLSVEQLDALFRADRAAIHSQLTGKTISIKGIVEKVVIRDHLDVRYLLLKGVRKNNAWNVRCSFERENNSEMNRLSEDQSVIIKGLYDGASKNILFKNCSLIG